MPDAAKIFRAHDIPPAERRGSFSQAAAGLISSKAWRRASKAFLAVNPMCAECLRQGRDTLAVHVDHVVPHRGDEVLFWEESNWQPLCRPCHSRKTQRGE
jgi:5-methylcytosine-specific restriction protein A